MLTGLLGTCCHVQGQLADRLVHSMYLDAFMQQAAYLVDWGSLQEANATFWLQHVVDERMPSSPSRRSGVGPKCTKCDRLGTVKDIYTKQRVRLVLLFAGWTCTSTAT
jgi:hypothetical protein